MERQSRNTDDNSRSEKKLIVLIYNLKFQIFKQFLMI